MTRLRRRTVVPLTAGAIMGVMLAVAAGWSASAVWTSHGSGSGSAISGSTATVTLAPGTAAADLLPGGQGDVLTIATSPSAPQRISTIAIDTSRGAAGIEVDPAHANCPPSAFTFTTQNNGGSGWTIPVSGSLAISLANAVTLSLDAPSTCQGASVKIYLVAS